MTAGFEGATYTLESVDGGDGFLNVPVLLGTFIGVLATIDKVDGGGGISNVRVLTGTSEAVLLLHPSVLHVAEVEVATAELDSAAVIDPLLDGTSESVSRIEAGRLLQILLVLFQFVSFMFVSFQ